MSLQQRVCVALKARPWTVTELAAALHVTPAGVHTALYRLRQRRIAVQQAPVVGPHEPRDTGRPMQRYWITTEAA